MKAVFSRLTLMVSICVMTMLSANVSAATDEEYSDSFKKVENPEQFMASEFKSAKAENKKLIFALGGNWCHDSRSLAKKLDDADLSKMISENYRLSLIDVGYLSDGYEFIEKANMTTYYATPTVLIFDPETGEQINSEDMHIWASAYTVSQDDTYAYFEKYSKGAQGSSAVKGAVKDSGNNLSKAQQAKLQELEQFIKLQEQRIKASYGVTGPMLASYKAGVKEPKFDEYWEVLSKMRNSLPADIKTVREQILAASDSEVAAIEMPKYETFPWE